MGFGWLLVGYLFLINPGVYDAFSNVIAASFMTIGMTMLKRYNRPFQVSSRLLFVYDVFALIRMGITAYAFLGFGTISPDTETLLAIGNKLLVLAFTITMFYGIESLALEVKITELQAGCIRGRVFSYIYYLLSAALEVSTMSEEMVEFAVRATIPVILVGVVVILLNAFTIFRCFQWICLPENLHEVTPLPMNDHDKK